MGYPCHLSAADGCAGPHGEDRENPHEEGQDGGQQEAPPLPLPATVLISFYTPSYIILTYSVATNNRFEANRIRDDSKIT